MARAVVVDLRLRRLRSGHRRARHRGAAAARRADEPRVDGGVRLARPLRRAHRLGAARTGCRPRLRPGLRVDLDRRTQHPCATRPGSAPRSRPRPAPSVGREVGLELAAAHGRPRPTSPRSPRCSTARSPTSTAPSSADRVADRWMRRDRRRRGRCRPGRACGPRPSWSRQGREVVVLEAGDAVGGRIRTDRVDGFLVDRGFQLLNPAYPAVRRWIDVDALRPPVVRRRCRGPHRRAACCTWGHPLRAPRLLPATLAGVGREPAPALALLRWLRPLLHRPGTHGARRARARRPTAPCTTRSTPPACAARCAASSTRSSPASSSTTPAPPRPPSRGCSTAMFAQGTPGAARRRHAGAAAAAGRRARRPGPARHPGLGRTTRGAGVRRRHRRRPADGRPRRRRRRPGGRRATDRDRPVADARRVVTQWFATPTPPTAAARCCTSTPGPCRSGPLVNTAVVSNAAPSYAPPGRHLVPPRR